MAEAVERYVDNCPQYLFYIIVLAINKSRICASFEVIAMRSFVSAEPKL
jgi:hypothetical protein